MSFSFKKFDVEDGRCAMKVGTDAVLLGAWTPTDGARTVLDVGAGSGVVSLMIAQRSMPDCKITAVELSTDAADDCRENFGNSSWSDRLEIKCSDFVDINGEFDLIVSNPPFFVGSQSSPTSARRLARQGNSLNYFSLIEFAGTHLSDNGRLSFISDVRHEKEILFTAKLNKLQLQKRCCIISRPGKPVVRILWLFSRANGNVESPEITQMVLRSGDNTLHPDYINLTKNFYIHL